jgi:hypothetical protein
MTLSLWDRNGVNTNPVLDTLVDRSRLFRTGQQRQALRKPPLRSGVALGVRHELLDELLREGGQEATGIPGDAQPSAD